MKWLNCLIVIALLVVAASWLFNHVNVWLGFLLIGSVLYSITWYGYKQLKSTFESVK
jgi:uncharacterized membrane protein